MSSLHQCHGWSSCYERAQSGTYINSVEFYDFMTFMTFFFLQDFDLEKCTTKSANT